MTQIDDQAGTPAEAGQAEGLQVRIGRQLAGAGEGRWSGLAGCSAGSPRPFCRPRLMRRWPITWGMRKASGSPSRPGITATGPRLRRC